MYFFCRIIIKIIILKYGTNHENYFLFDGITLCVALKKKSYKGSIQNLYN
jgi:hypothetical protein